MKPIYILKIGGSIATHKNRSKSSVRRTLLKKIARSLKKALEKNNFHLILVHGAGSFGHSLAQQYDLKNGTGKDAQKWHGAIISRLANQKLDAAIAEIFIAEGLQVTPVHTASVIVQKNKKIELFQTHLIEEALKQNCIPMLYGEMVFDEKLGMTICSGDAIAPLLAKKLNATKIFHASDIDGIFTQDPYLHKDAQLIENISLKQKSKLNLSKSHNVDTTNGLLGKMEELNILHGSSVKSVEIFNGFQEDNYEKVLAGKTFAHTTIEI